MVAYRTFRNTDPPGLVEVWNEAITSRGAVRLRNASPLETYVFAKPYFDPAGLIVAEDNGTQVGFAHAGFGPNDTEAALSTGTGVTCLLGVRPSHRRHGVGSELLRRCEAYLKGRGAQALFAGPMRPLNPFYFGLYGGSEPAGLLASNDTVTPFLTAHGYQPVETRLIFQRRLDQAISVPDARFALLRRRFDLQVLPRTTPLTWWQECVTGPLEFLEFRLIEKAASRPVARAELWEMEGFSWTWGLPSVGILWIEVREDLRRQGLAKFLVSHIVRYMQEQYFGLAEVQAMESNQPAINLYRSLGFSQIDLGRLYRKGDGPAPAPPQASP